ncbi:MAG: hypothetical protein R3331_02115 [Sulfurospirillaceae bacterium]|nr:hypothetical protein [Sulfurospirillaceae bacterium]
MTPTLNNNLADMFVASTPVLQTAPIQSSNLSTFDKILYGYDNMISNASNSADQTLTDQAIAQEKFKQNASNMYTNFKASLGSAYDTISKDLNISKNILIYGSIAAGSLFLWDKIGRDIYYMTQKGK